MLCCDVVISPTPSSLYLCLSCLLHQTCCRLPILFQSQPVFHQADHYPSAAESRYQCVLFICMCDLLGDAPNCVVKSNDGNSAPRCYTLCIFYSIASSNQCTFNCTFMRQHWFQPQQVHAGNYLKLFELISMNIHICVTEFGTLRWFHAYVVHFTLLRVLADFTIVCT